MDKAQQEQIEQVAWEATVGAGNFQEIVDFQPLYLHLFREAGSEEKRIYRQAWEKCIQSMEQP